MARVREPVLDVRRKKSLRELLNLRISELRAALLHPAHERSDCESWVPGGETEDSLLLSAFCL